VGDDDHSINHPEVVGAIRGTLVKRGVPQQELQDRQHDVQAETLALQQKLGIGDPGVPRTKAMATKIASNDAIDEGREQAAQRTRDEKKQYPQAHAAPPARRGEDALNAQIDHARRIQQLDEMVKDGTITEGQIEALDRLASGEKRAKVAEDLGTKPKSLDKQVNKARERILTKFGVVAASLLTMNVVWNQVVADRWIKAHSVDAIGTTRVTVRRDAPHVHETQEHAAARLRRSGVANCALHYWDACLKDLDAAQDLDPQSNLDPEVQKARLDMMNLAGQEQGRDNEAKVPGYRGPGPKK
jgi:hypothetical protein